MKCIKYLTLLFILFSRTSISQTNLVSNPGFENHTLCPNFMLQWDRCIGWYNCNGNIGNGLWGTPDYYHTCSTPSYPYNPLPPNTGMGYCNPHTGNAMMGLVCYNLSYANYREYISSALTCPMTAGNTYTVSFWITASSAPTVQYNSSHFGVYLSNSMPSQSTYFVINVTPQYEIPTIISNTIWQQYTFTISPTSSLNYITLGCFKNETLISTSLMTPGATQPYSNYFIDDIEVLNPSSGSVGISSVSNFSVCAGQSTIINPSGSNNYSITPSNTTGTSFTVNPTITTTYTISDANTASCIQSSTIVTIYVNPSPALTVNSTTLCAGETATLTANAISGYTWSPSSLNTQSILVQPLTTTIYTVSTTNGICNASSNATVTVIPLPVISVANSTVCAGQQDTLTAIGGTTYTWQPSSTNSSTIAIQPLTNTIYTVTGSNGFCSSTSNSSITVLSTPALSVNSATVCAGKTATITATSTSGYTWSPSGINTSTISVQPLATSLYNISSSNGICTSVATSTVTVLPVPLISVNNAGICTGQTATLTASGANTYTWLPSGLNTPTISAQPLTNTIYTITGSNGICASSTNATVTVTSFPVISTTNATICAGQTVTLTANGATGYTWQPTALNTNSIIVQPLVNIIYTVTGSNGTCSSIANASITVLSSPTLSVNSPSICSAQTATLIANSTSGYTWSPSGINTSSISVQPLINTVYTVSSSNGICTSVAHASVTVLPFPILAVNSMSICAGQTGTLVAAGATTYTWLPTGANTQSIVVAPIANTIYTITGSNGVCASTFNASIVILSLPVISVNSFTICAGETVTLTASGASTYTWFPVTQLNNSTGNAATANPITNTIYTVTGTSIEGCNSFAISTVSVITNGGLTATTSATTICVGSSATLTAGGVSTGSYTWSALPISPINTINSNPAIVTPSLTTLYTLSAFVGVMPNRCTFTKTVTVAVAPNTNVLTGYVDPICFGSYTTLTAKGGNKYSWSLTVGLNHPGDSVTTAAPLTTTVYTVTVSKNGICPKTGTVQVIVNPIPYVYAGIDTTINIDEHIVLTGNGNVEVGFILSNNNSLTCNFCSQITINPQENTCYILRGTNEYNCVNTDTICVTVTKDWDVFIPNAFTPNGDSDNDIFIPVGYGLSEIHLTIFDRWGAVIFKSNVDKIGWDGSFKGQICKQDVYVYKAEILTMAGYTVMRTGHVTLLPKIK